MMSYVYPFLALMGLFLGPTLRAPSSSPQHRGEAAAPRLPQPLSNDSVAVGSNQGLALASLGAGYFSVAVTSSLLRAKSLKHL